MPNHVSSFRIRVLMFAAILVAFAATAQACLWDWDTLQMERRLYPGTLEMITGRFVRHSREYYEWRIEDRTPRFYSAAENPDIADDLAVAYLKLGRFDDAISLLEQALQAHPDRYETLSNLGTVQMLAGNLELGKQYIDQALAINPNAHFGREKYQSLLADYFLTAREKTHPVAMDAMLVRASQRNWGFGAFVLNKIKSGVTPETNDVNLNQELIAAQTGVLGMMHFANYDSPLLLEALGDLLIASPSSRQDALQLAARAYYRISQVSKDEATKQQFANAARNTISPHMDYLDFSRETEKPSGEGGRDVLDKLKADLERELEAAEAFVAGIAADEKRWIADGINVDQAFAAKYYDSLEHTVQDAKKQLSREWRDDRQGPFEIVNRRSVVVLIVLVSGLIGLVVWSVRAFRRYQARQAKPTHST